MSKSRTKVKHSPPMRPVSILRKTKAGLRSKLEDLIYETIAEINDSYTDDMLVDMIEDPEYNEEAIDHLIEILQDIREGN